MAFEFEQTLLAFTQVMRDKLNENQHKPHWKQGEYKEGGLHELLKRLEEEKKELIQAVTWSDCTSREIARECADVACYAMFIADVSNGLKIIKHINFKKLEDEISNIIANPGEYVTHDEKEKAQQIIKLLKQRKML